jgi:hypothetical protein
LVREQRKEEVIVWYPWATSSSKRPLGQVDNFIFHPSGDQVFTEGCMQKFISSARLPLIIVSASSTNLGYLWASQHPSLRSVDEEELSDDSLPGLHGSGTGHEPWI